MKRLVSLLMMVLLAWNLQAQVHRHAEAPKSLLELFTKGKASGHIRNFFMATRNRGPAKDYWTNATGGALAYHTAPWKGFEFGVKGIFTYQTISADLNAEDPLVGKSAKWEKELYDLTNPQNTRNLDRLEELYVKYRWGKKSYAEIGKIDIDRTPLIGRRDGRMKPFVYQGAWAEIHLKNQNDLSLGLINGVSPRSMTEWYTFSEAIGLLNNGCQPDGDPAEYKHHVGAKGMGIAGYRHGFGERFSVEAWDFYLDQLVNISWMEVDWREGKWEFGGQYVHESPLRQQVKLDYENRFMQPGERANVMAFKAGYAPRKNIRLSANALHAFGTGRFLYPKELGRDHFFTSISRSRFNGLGNATVFTLTSEFAPQRKLKGAELEMAFTHLIGPGTKSAQFNKYTISDYNQLNVRMAYRFSGHLQGLQTEILYVLNDASTTGLDPDEAFNKHDFHQINFVTNINF